MTINNVCICMLYVWAKPIKILEIAINSHVTKLIFNKPTQNNTDSIFHFAIKTGNKRKRHIVIGAWMLGMFVIWHVKQSSAQSHPIC